MPSRRRSTTARAKSRNSNSILTASSRGWPDSKALPRVTQSCSMVSLVDSAVANSTAPQVQMSRTRAWATKPIMTATETATATPKPKPLVLRADVSTAVESFTIPTMATSSVAMVPSRAKMTAVVVNPIVTMQTNSDSDHSEDRNELLQGFGIRRASRPRHG